MKRCGVTEPTGTKDGRRVQTVVFPSPGTHHTYPHITAPLRGCATSGLPVAYAVDTADQSANCELVPADNPTHVELRGTAGGCTIIASQTGDSTWASAEPVRQEFRVGYQPVTLSWADPRVDMRYPGSLSVHIGIESPDPLDASIEMGANGSCDFDGSDTTYISVNRRTVITATVTVRDPGPDGRGECTLSASVMSDHTRPNPVTPRTYRVLGPATSRSSVPSPR